MMKHGYHLHIRLSPAAEQCKGSAGGFSPKSMSANSANLISTDSTVIWWLVLALFYYAMFRQSQRSKDDTSISCACFDWQRIRGG